MQRCGFIDTCLIFVQVPLLVMTVLGEYPGLCGTFMAGVFSAALSSLSTALNSMSAVNMHKTPVGSLHYSSFLVYIRNRLYLRTL